MARETRLRRINRLNHMHRNPNRPPLVRNRPRDGLPYPPGRVGGKLKPPPVLKLVHRLHQPDVPLLDQVQGSESRGWCISSAMEITSRRFARVILSFASRTSRSRSHSSLESSSNSRVFQIALALGFHDALLQVLHFREVLLGGRPPEARGVHLPQPPQVGLVSGKQIQELPRPHPHLRHAAVADLRVILPQPLGVLLPYARSVSASSFRRSRTAPSPLPPPPAPSPGRCAAGRAFSGGDAPTSAAASGFPFPVPCWTSPAAGRGSDSVSATCPGAKAKSSAYSAS